MSNASEHIKKLSKRTPKPKDTYKSEYLHCLDFILYPDSSIYNCSVLLDNLVKNSSDLYDYLYICHNRDFVSITDVSANGGHDFESIGKPKKDHYHVYVRFFKEHRVSSFKTLIGLPENHFIEPIKPQKWDSAIVYPFHEDYEDKAHYTTDECVTSIKPYIEWLLVQRRNERSTPPIHTQILEYIDTNTREHNLTYTELFKFICDNNILPFKEAIKCFSTLKHILQEQNRLSSAIADEDYRTRMSVLKKLSAVSDESVKLLYDLETINERHSQLIKTYDPITGELKKLEIVPLDLKGE